MLKENQKRLQFTPQYRNKNIWAAWYFINALDVHSTLKGLKYSCISEANPTLPPVPHRDHLIIHKALLLSTIFNPNAQIGLRPDSYSQSWRDSDIAVLNMMVGFAVINNQELTNKVKKYPNTCPKRG